MNFKNFLDFVEMSATCLPTSNAFLNTTGGEIINLC